MALCVQAAAPVVRRLLAPSWLAVLLLAGCVQPDPPAPSTADDGRATLDVEVIDALTGDAIDGVRLELHIAGIGTVRKVTDADGAASLTVRPAESCTLVASRVDYIAAQAKLGCREDNRFRVPLKPVASASSSTSGTSRPSPSPSQPASNQTPTPAANGNTTANQTATLPAGNQTGTAEAFRPFPSPCIGPPAPEASVAAVPMAGQHCVPPEELTIDGRLLGFTDTYEVDWVRPGINLGPCSTSYMLTDDTGALFLTQSAHCIYEVSGGRCAATEAPWGSSHAIEGYAQPAALVWSSGRHMAEHGATDEECRTWDMAILRLPDGLRDVAHPAIRHIGGPTGLADPLAVRVFDPMTGYGNSDDRGFVVEMATGDDHGNAPLWPTVNVFQGHFAGELTDEPACAGDAVFVCAWNTAPYGNGMRADVRYQVPKITGDSGSADLMADGRAFGITSVLDFSATAGTSFVYDALLRIWQDTGVRYRLVTWDEWSPETIETGI